MVWPVLAITYMELLNVTRISSNGVTLWDAKNVLVQQLIHLVDTT